MKVSFKLTVFALISLLAAACIASLCIGSVDVPLSETIGVLLSPLTKGKVLPFRPENQPIIFALRLPRILLAVLVGASLSVSGAAMQGLIKNPLADGSTLGAAAGGSLGAVIAIALGVSIPFLPQLTITVFGIVGSFLSLILVMSFVRKVDKNLSSNTIILAGIIFSMLVSSITNLVISFAGDAVKRIVFWSMGSLGGRGYIYVAIMAAFSIIGIVGIMKNSRELDAFAMGEEQAAYAGIDVKRVRVKILIYTSVVCGAAVSICGNIAFVGLAIPHIIRLLVGPVHTRLIPASAIAGAAFLVICDLLSRVLIRPIELPIGVLTSICGAIVFISVFFRQRKEAV